MLYMVPGAGDPEVWHPCAGGVSFYRRAASSWVRAYRSMYPAVCRQVRVSGKGSQQKRLLRVKYSFSRINGRPRALRSELGQRLEVSSVEDLPIRLIPGGKSGDDT